MTCDGNFACSPAYNVPTSSSTGSSGSGSTGSAPPSGSGSSVSCSCCVGEGCTKQFVGTVTTSQTCSAASLRSVRSDRQPPRSAAQRSFAVEVSPRFLTQRSARLLINCSTVCAWVCRALCSERYPSKCPAGSAAVGAACEAIADGVVDPDESALLFAAFYTDSSCSTLHGQRLYLKNVCFETTRQNTLAHTRRPSDPSATTRPTTRAARSDRSLCFAPPCASASARPSVCRRLPVRPSASACVFVCVRVAAEYTKFKCDQWAWTVNDYAATDSTCGGASLAGASGEGPETCAPYKKADGTVLGYARVNCNGDEFGAANSAASASLLMAAALAAAVALFSRA